MNENVNHLRMLCQFHQWDNPSENCRGTKTCLEMQASDSVSHIIKNLKAGARKSFFFQEFLQWPND